MMATFVKTVPFEPLFGNKAAPVRSGKDRLDREHGGKHRPVRHLSGVYLSADQVSDRDTE
jgi:hypothetical protein